MVDSPAFAAQKRVQTAVPVANVNAGKVAQANAQRVAAPGLALVVVRRAAQSDELAGAAATNLKTDMQKVHQVALMSRLQSFFAITS